MKATIAWGDLDRSDQTIDSLRIYLREEGVRPWAGIHGLRLKFWISDRLTNRWGAVMLWESTADLKAPMPPNRAAGLVFTSHADSRKGRNLAATGWASGVLYWRETGRQAIVTGPVARLPDAESDALWAARPVVSGYALSFGLVLVAGGRLGDTLGWRAGGLAVDLLCQHPDLAGRAGGGGAPGAVPAARWSADRVPDRRCRRVAAGRECVVRVAAAGAGRKRWAGPAVVAVRAGTGAGRAVPAV